MDNWKKTKEFATIINSITNELESESYNFNTDANTLKNAGIDFYLELESNTLMFQDNFIFSRIRKYFGYDYTVLETQDLENFDDADSELLSEYICWTEFIHNHLLYYRGCSLI